MSYLIAVSGKGGVGKTTISAALVRALKEKGKTPILAIDADPNSCLDTMLGVSVSSSIGTARENVRTEADAAGISKQELLRLKIAESLVESSGFDMISMGRPEGAGCYCYANNVLKTAIGELSSAYPYVVLDNEAGLENLSRRIVQKVDMLVLVSDASVSGIKTLKRLYDLALEMGVEHKKLAMVINRMRGELSAEAKEVADYIKADVVLAIPFDGGIADVAEEGRSIWELKEQSIVLSKTGELIEHF